MIDTKLFRDRTQIKYDATKNKFVEINSDDSDYSFISDEHEYQD